MEDTRLGALGPFLKIALPEKPRSERSRDEVHQESASGDILGFRADNPSMLLGWRRLVRSRHDAVSTS
jgi:hypothetical protein